jgi:hypothetical protein
MNEGIRVSSDCPCRICQKPDWCLYFPDGTAFCNRVSDGLEKMDTNGTLYWVYPPENRQPDWQAPKYEAPKAPDVSKDAPQVYAYALSLMSLSADHRDSLSKRGISNLDKYGFKSAYSRDSYRVAKAVFDKFPDTATGVPGFSVKDGRPSFGVSDGLVIPVKNLKGVITSLRLRKDEAVSGGRYRCLSSVRHGGPGPGSQIGFWGFPEDGRADTVRITEGEFKGIIASELTGIPTISAPGVSQLASASVTSALSMRIQAKTVLLAPDSDATTNLDVTRAVRTAIARLKGVPGKAKRWKLFVEVWNPDHKGIDDALVAGCDIKRLTPAEYLATLPPEVTNETKAPAESADLPQLERALLAIGGDCDGATDRDGVGFNSKDTDFFAMHLDTVRKGQLIALKFRAKAFDRLSKYSGQLLQLGFNLNEIAAEEDAKKAELKEKGESEKELTQAEILLELVEDWELIRWQGQFYASFLVENQEERKGTYRRETHRFSRAGVRAQLYYAFKKREGYPPNSEAIASVVMSLESDAQFEGQDREVFIRTAHHEGKFYIDLQDGFGTAVCVSEIGWELTNDPPVLFIRPSGSASLPYPEKGGNLDGFKRILGIGESAWILLVSWLVFGLTPFGPFPVLLLEASAGSAKSTFVRMLKQLVDPSQHAPRGKPVDEEALVMQACNCRCVVLDNLVQLAGSISDLICTLSTRGSLSKRKLYTDDEEHVISFCLPVILAGIVGIVTKPDLGDRTLKISPPLIPEHKRRRESEVMAEFDPMRAQIFGCLLDAVSAGIRNEGKVKLPPLPRMADFAAFICQAEEALPWEPGAFIKAFQEHRLDQVEAALEGDPLASACRQLVALNGSWQGTPSELRERLSKLVLREDVLPSVLKLGQRLRVLQPYLAQVGVQVSEGKSNGVRFMKLARPEVRDILPALPTLSGSKALKIEVPTGSVAGSVEKSTDPADPSTDPVESADRVGRIWTGSVENSTDPATDPEKSPIPSSSEACRVGWVGSSTQTSGSDLFSEFPDEDRETFEL